MLALPLQFQQPQKLTEPRGVDAEPSGAVQHVLDQVVDRMGLREGDCGGRGLGRVGSSHEGAAARPHFDRHGLPQSFLDAFGGCAGDREALRQFTNRWQPVPGLETPRHHVRDRLPLHLGRVGEAAFAI